MDPRSLSTEERERESEREIEKGTLNHNEDDGERIPCHINEMRTTLNGN